MRAETDSGGGDAAQLTRPRAEPPGSAAREAPTRDFAPASDSLARLRAEHEQQFRILADSIPQLAWIAEGDGAIHWYNQRWYAYTGTTPEQMLGNGGWGWESVHDPEILPRVKAHFQKAVESGEPWEDTFPLRRHDGVMRRHLSRAMPVRDHSGKIVRWFGTNTDIEDQRRAGNRLQELVMQAPVAIAIFKGEDCVIELANARICQIWGRRPEEVLNKPLFEAMPEQADQGFEALLDQVRVTGKPFIGNELPAKVARLSTHALHELYINIVFEPLFAADGRVESVMVVASEVTETVRARQQMELIAAEAKSSEERLTFSLKAGGLGSWQIDLRTRKFQLYPGFFENLGIAISGQADEGRLRSLVHPEDLPRLEQSIGRAAAEHSDLAVEFRLLAPSGALRWAIMRGRVAYAPDGTPLSMAGVTLDITSHKLAELERERLVQELAGAVRVRDEFLSVASHELKTPLTPLGLRLSQLRKDVRLAPDGPRARLEHNLDVAERQVRKLSALIEDLLDVSRLSNGRIAFERKPMDLSALLKEVVALFEPEALRVRCELDVKAEPDVLGAWDVLRLEQVISNLLSNALKYGAGKPIQIELFTDEGFAELRIRDQGIGLEPGAEERIFGRFERAVSDRNYGGLGLGLWVTRQIVEALGGTVTARAAPLRGALFTVRLPLQLEESSSLPEASRPYRPRGDPDQMVGQRQ